MEEWHFEPAHDLGLNAEQRRLSLHREVGLESALSCFLWRSITRFYLAIAHRIRIHGRENLPMHAPFVLVANHASHLDAVILGAILPLRFVGAVFPIAAGAAVGFSSLDAGWFLLTRSMRASRLQTFLKLQLPAGLPSIFGGLKVGAALAVVGAVVGEFIGSDAGLSYLLLIANANRDTATEFACLILLSLMGVLFYGLVALAESIMLPWRNPDVARWSAQGTP